MSEMRGCDLVVDYLIKEETPYIFGYAGHGAVGLLDGIYHRQDDIKLVWPRIESAAGYMADAYFRATGIPIPVYTSTGPGPMLLTVAMGNAFFDSSSFIAITGQVATTQFDSGALQEEYRHYSADFPGIARRVSKRSFQAHSVEDLEKILPQGASSSPARAPRTGAHRRPLRPLDPDRRRRDAGARGALAAPAMAHGGLARGGCGALSTCSQVRARPLILAGGGVLLSEASEQLAELAEHLNIPVYSTFMGKGALSARHPLHLGIAGCWGEYPATEAAGRGRDPRLRRPLQRHPLLLLGPWSHVQHPAHAADRRRPRSVRDRPQLPDRAGHRRRRARGPAADDRAGPEARSEARALALDSTRSRATRPSGRTTSRRSSSPTRSRSTRAG